MGRLLNVIRREQGRRSDGGEMMVIIVNKFCKDFVVPKARIVSGKALFEKAPDEPFEVFKARAVAAARASGANFVAIEVPAPLEGGPRSNSLWS
jgi:hypothetical protein